MSQNQNKKVCLIVDSLTGGGAERAASKISIKLADFGYKVSIILIRNEISYDFKGRLFNLGTNESNIKIFKQISKLFKFRKAYKRANADVYIDFRMRNRFIMEWLLFNFVFKTKKMIMAVRSYKIEFYVLRFNFFYRKYNQVKAIPVVAKLIADKMLKAYDFKNLVYIPNFYSTDILKIDFSRLYLKDQSFIVAVGRLDNKVKQFDKLILAYQNSKLMSKDLPLYIIGEGKDKAYLENLIKTNNLTNNVKLLGFVPSVYAYVKKAKFLILTSKFEGFPNVILESLALGTPVISFDCKSGPSEMIVDKHNGVLVEDQNFYKLTDAMNKMSVDDKFYNYCKSNTLNSVSKFSEELVMKKWIELIES